MNQEEAKIVIEDSLHVWAELLLEQIDNALIPNRFKRLPPMIIQSHIDSAKGATLRVFSKRNIRLIETLERKQNETLNAIEALNAEIKLYKRNIFKWQFIPAKRREVLQAQGILDGFKIALGVIATTKP